METKILIFLAFISFALIFNAFVIWYAYKAFAKASMMVADTIRDIETSDSAKTWIKTLAVASSSAATLSESARSELVNVDHVIARGQAHFEYKLAEIDTHLDRAFGTILRKTESAQQSIVGPAEKLGATISGVREVVQFLSGEVERIQSGGDATPTPKT